MKRIAKKVLGYILTALATLIYFALLIVLTPPLFLLIVFSPAREVLP